MEAKEIAAALVKIEAALVEKTGEQPFCSSSLMVRTSGKAQVQMWKPNSDFWRVPASETISEAIEAARDFVAAMPDPEAAKLTAWHGKLADVIDEGHALNLPDDVMTPLRQSSQAMTENLLTHAVK